MLGVRSSPRQDFHLLPPALSTTESIRPSTRRYPAPAKANAARCVWVALTLATVLSGCGGGGDSAAGSSTAAGTAAGDSYPTAPAGNASGTGASTGCLGGLSQAQLLARINTLRGSARQCGSSTYAAAPALVWNTALAAAAQRHSDDMASHDFFDHTGSDGSGPGERILAAGYSGGWAENIGAGYESVDAVLAGWLGSAAHCANLMDADGRDVALSCASNTASSDGTYWTLVVGMR